MSEINGLSPRELTIFFKVNAAILDAGFPSGTKGEEVLDHKYLDKVKQIVRQSVKDVASKDVASLQRGTLSDQLEGFALKQEPAYRKLVQSFQSTLDGTAIKFDNLDVQIGLADQLEAVSITSSSQRPYFRPDSEELMVMEKAERAAALNQGRAPICQPGRVECQVDTNYNGATRTGACQQYDQVTRKIINVCKPAQYSDRVSNERCEESACDYRVWFLVPDGTWNGLTGSTNSTRCIAIARPAARYYSDPYVIVDLGFNTAWWCGTASQSYIESYMRISP